MTYRTVEDSKKMPCPIARTFGSAGEKVRANCRADACMLWRWRAMSAMDPRFLGAVTRETELLKAQNPDKPAGSFHKEAVKRVTKDPTAYTFPDPEVDTGFCGLGGAPEHATTKGYDNAQG